MKHQSHWAKSFPMKRFSFNIPTFSCNYCFIRKVLKQLCFGICVFILIIVFLLGPDHSVKKSTMTVETESSNVNDSNQEAEPAQLLDDEANKNVPVKKKTSCCTGLKVWCLINITTNYCCHMLRIVVQDTTWQITSFLFCNGYTLEVQGRVGSCLCPKENKNSWFNIFTLKLLIGRSPFWSLERGSNLQWKTWSILK